MSFIQTGGLAPGNFTEPAKYVGKCLKTKGEQTGSH